MLNLLLKLFVIVILITCGPFGCRSISHHDASADQCNINVGLQLQKSLVLSAGRYTMLLHAIQKGNFDEASNDIDYWLDSAIVELQFLEESYPETRWNEIPIQGTEEVKMTNLYRNIARYRDTHPRRHTISLDANQKRLINAFVERYKQEL